MFFLASIAQFVGAGLGIGALTGLLLIISGWLHPQPDDRDLPKLPPPQHPYDD